jgi:hypothetical protein
MIARLLNHLYARSLLTAHQRWQELLGVWESDCRDFDRSLEGVKLAAQRAGVAAPDQVGVLKQAHEKAKLVFPSRLQKAHDHLKTAFDLLGTSRWRWASPSLFSLLEEYEALILAERQTRQTLRNRLDLAQKVLAEIMAHPEYAQSLPPERILEFPEYAEALLPLAKRRLTLREAALERLQQSFRRRLKVGEGWLRLLKSHLRPFKYGFGKLNLQALESKAEQKSEEMSFWLQLHKEIDPYLMEWNRKALASLPRSKNIKDPSSGQPGRPKRRTRPKTILPP